MSQKTLGDQELALLRWVESNGRATAGEVSADFGQSAGLARSTIETVLERLRKKGFLRRAKVNGVYRYEPTTASQEVMGGLVEQFVKRTLGGSFTPLVTYFTKKNCLSDPEIRELERLVAKLESSPSGPK